MIGSNNPNPPRAGGSFTDRRRGARRGRASHVAFAIVLAAVVSASAGCYVGGARPADPRVLTPAQGWLRAEDVALTPQQREDDCGAAALSMVMGALHVPMRRDEIVALAPPREGGIRAGDLRDIARRRGLRAYVVAGRRQDLLDQLVQRRPVLVGLAKPLSNGRAALHYEVVAGLRQGSWDVLTADPFAGWRTFSWESFAREWAATGAVTLIVLPGADVQASARPLDQKIWPAAK